MQFAEIVKRRLEDQGLDQRELAAAAEVTESYVSQLLNQKKPPPAPERTDIYAKMEAFLGLPAGELARLAEIQRREELTRKLSDPPTPLFREVRELILSKCHPPRRDRVAAIFEREAFGTLERLVTGRLLDAVKDVTRSDLDREQWLPTLARLADLSRPRLRVAVLEFLDTNILEFSIANSLTFLDPLVESWDIDLDTFALEVTLNPRLVPDAVRSYEFQVSRPEEPLEEEPGLREFLGDPSLSGDATPEEIAFLRQLRFDTRRPTPLYYYRALQNLRDPVHFYAPASE